MTFHIIKIPVISGFENKTSHYEVVLEYETDNLKPGITDALDMRELLEIINYDDGEILNNFEFNEDSIYDYSNSQWESCISIPLRKILIDDICPESAWNYFTSS